MGSGKVCIVGAGISGMTAANSLADAGITVQLVDALPNPGGRALHYGCKAGDECVHCGVCLVRNELSRLDSQQNIDHLFSTKVVSSDRSASGGYEIRLERSANRIDHAACVDCGECVGACPEEAITFVPGWGHVIDESCSGCGQCVGSCGFNAIHAGGEPESIEISVDSVVVATGFTPFDPSINRKWGTGESDRVITGTELERLFASEQYLPTSDAERVAFVQCVGSRNVAEGSSLCSRVCCAYALRMANRLKTEFPEIAIDFYYMDLQHLGKSHERYLVETEHHVNMIRSNPIAVKHDAEGFPIVRFESMNDRRVSENRYDYVVLSHGITPSSDTADIAKMFGLHVTANGFLVPPGAEGDVDIPAPIDGRVLVAGAVNGPRGIAECVEQAQEVAAIVSNSMSTLVSEGL